MALFEKAIVIDVGTYAIKGVSYKFSMGELEILDCRYQALSEFGSGPDLEKLETEAADHGVTDDETPLPPAGSTGSPAAPGGLDESRESSGEVDDADAEGEDESESEAEIAGAESRRAASLLARIIGRFIASHWGLDNTFVINLTGQHLLIRDIVVPFSEPRKVLEILPFELESQISLPLDRVIVEASVWGAKPEGGATALTLCALREHVQERSEWFLDEQLPLKAVTADPISLSRLVTDRMPASETLCGQLDVGGRVSVLNLIYKGELVFTRTLHFGGTDFDLVLADALKLEPAEAETAKREIALDVSDPEANDNNAVYKKYKINPAKLKKIAAAFGELIDELAHEVEVSVVACPAKQELETLYVSGGGSRLPGFAAYLARALTGESAPVERRGESRANPERRAIPRRQIEVTLYEPPPGFPEPSAYDVFANAVGMIYHQCYNRSRPVDFLKGELRAALKGRKDWRMLLGPASMFAASLAMSLFGFICEMRGTTRAATETKAELCDEYVKAFQPSVQAKDKEKACGEDPLYKAKQSMKSASIGVDVAKTVPLVQVLDALKMIGEAMPDSAVGWEFNNLEVKVKETLITGIVADFAAVTKVLEALKAKNLFENVEVVKKSPAGKLSAGKVMATYKIVFKKPGKN